MNSDKFLIIIHEKKKAFKVGIFYNIPAFLDSLSVLVKENNYDMIIPIIC